MSALLIIRMQPTGRPPLRISTGAVSHDARKAPGNRVARNQGRQVATLEEIRYNGSGPYRWIIPPTAGWCCADTEVYRVQVRRVRCDQGMQVGLRIRGRWQELLRRC